MAGAIRAKARIWLRPGGFCNRRGSRMGSVFSLGRMVDETRPSVPYPHIHGRATSEPDFRCVTSRARRDDRLSGANWPLTVMGGLSKVACRCNGLPKNERPYGASQINFN